MLQKELRPDQYIKITYEPQVFDLYRSFDLFVHVPINRDAEAFGQTYIETLYAEIPSVFTLSGIAHDFIRNRENAMIVPYRDSKAIYEAMKLLLEDEALRTKLINSGKKKVRERFAGDILARELDELYSDMLQGSS